MFFTECSGLADGGNSYEDGWVSAAQWWMSQLLLPVMKRNFTMALAWNLALDNSFGPRLQEAYCDNCMGTVQVMGQQVFTGAPQHALFGHFALASSNLTRFGGGPAHNTPVAVAQHAQSCLDATAFTAPWAPTNTSKFTHRYGLVVHNNCYNVTQATVAMESTGQAETLQLPHGVSTFVWSL